MRAPKAIPQGHHGPSLTVPRVNLLACRLLLSAGTSAVATSFDCQKASTPVERALCASAGLSELDSTLAGHYQRALVTQAPEQRDALRSSQRAWLHTRGNPPIFSARQK